MSLTPFAQLDAQEKEAALFGRVAKGLTQSAQAAKSLKGSTAAGKAQQKARLNPRTATPGQISQVSNKANLAGQAAADATGNWRLKIADFLKRMSAGS